MKKAVSNARAVGIVSVDNDFGCKKMIQVIGCLQCICCLVVFYMKVTITHEVAFAARDEA